MRGLSPAAASGGHSSSRCAGLSPSRPLLLRSTGSRRAGSVTVAHGPSCSAACGIFPDQGSNPCPPHWQADSQPLRHQGSPISLVLSSDFRFHPMTSSVPVRAFRAGAPSADVITPAPQGGNSPGPGESRTKVGSYRRLSFLGTCPLHPILRGCSKAGWRGPLTHSPTCTCQLCGLGQVKSLPWSHSLSVAEEREVIESNGAEEQ